MTRDRSIQGFLLCVIICLLLGGGSIEILGAVFMLGVIVGCMIGAAATKGERETTS